MARTATITLNGKNYTLLYNVRVIAEIEDTGAKYSEFWDSLADSVRSRVLFLSLLMQAGYRYDTSEGLNPPEPMTVDQILDETPAAEQGKIYAAILDAVKVGGKRNVEARPKSKKANGATQAE